MFAVLAVILWVVSLILHLLGEGTKDVEYLLNLGGAICVALHLATGYAPAFINRRNQA